MTSFLLIGLGNPGKDYAGNRHNIGFMALERIMDDYRFGKPVKKFGGVIAEGNIDGQKVFTFAPLSYMNLSGEPAVKAASFYKILPERILVIHDELDLPLGKLKTKRGGGHGGHNGLKSLDANITPEYLRLRLGIGHPGDKDLVSDYVLSDFSKAEKKSVETLLAEVSRHIGLLVAGDEPGFTNQVALNLQATS